MEVGWCHLPKFAEIKDDRAMNQHQSYWLQKPGSFRYTLKLLNIWKIQWSTVSMHLEYSKQ